MSRALIAILGVFFIVGCVHADERAAQIFNENLARQRQLDIEERRVAIEEKRLYLSTLEHSQITEEKARAISLWVLQNLKDYPQGRKAKHLEEDVRLLIETISSLEKPNASPPIPK